MTEDIGKPRLVGRSSSSFTRVTRIFAAELGVDYELRVVPDLLSADSADYAGNPALKMPMLETSEGVLFGSLNICRALALRSARPLRIVWPEALTDLLLANAQELAVHALATEVNLIMSKQRDATSESPHQVKLRASLLNVMAWLDAKISAVLASLPADRDLSFLEVALFCLVTHLEFRSVVPVTSYANLANFCAHFAERESARATEYHFDSPR